MKVFSLIKFGFAEFAVYPNPNFTKTLLRTRTQSSEHLYLVYMGHHIFNILTTGGGFWIPFMDIDDPEMDIAEQGIWLYEYTF